MWLIRYEEVQGSGGTVLQFSTWGEWLAWRSAALTPGKSRRYPMDKSLAGHDSRSGAAVK
jgi:hypothetical protein